MQCSTTELPHVLHAVRTGALGVLQLGPDTEARDLNRDNPVQFTQIAQFNIVQQAYLLSAQPTWKQGRAKLVRISAASLTVWWRQAQVEPVLTGLYVRQLACGRRGGRQDAGRGWGPEGGDYSIRGGGGGGRGEITVSEGRK